MQKAYTLPNLPRPLASRGTRRQRLQYGTVLAAALASGLLTPVLTQAQALPSGGQVVAGSADIAGSGASVTITQSSDKAIIDWTNFSIGQGGTVDFNNGSGATLNRVTGGNLSSIDGLLSATGSVYLINPNGVVIGKSGVVRVGGDFVAATLDIGNANFLAGGDLTFEGPSLASVVNLGQIGALGGDVALVAANVRNDGSVIAPNGALGLLAGNRILMRDAAVDDGRFLVLSGGAGTFVTNTGTIEAATAELRAEGGNVYALAGNTQGLIRATGVSSHDGRIYLSAGTGSVEVAGTTLAATRANDGGRIDVTGQTISVATDATLDVSGKDIGGTAMIIADMASGQLDFHGTAVARGDLTGGFVETSGRKVDYNRARIDTTGATSGTWLVDPDDLTVDATAAATINTNLATTNVTLQTTATTASGPGNSTSGSGDIIINSDISWSSANTLTLDSYHSINVNANLTASGAGGVMLKTNHGGSNGDYAFAYGKSLSFTGAGGALTINGDAYTLLYSMTDVAGMNNSGGNFALAKPLDASGTTYTGPVVKTFGTLSPRSGNFTGLGNTISNLTINAPSGNFVALIDENFGTVRDIGLPGANIIGHQYAAPLIAANYGTVKNAYASGSVTASSASAGGLIGGIYMGDVSNVFASTNVYSADAAGGLAASLFYGSLSDAFATGSVTSPGSIVGGLLGYQASGTTVANVYATGMVSGGSYFGGLIGSRPGGSTTNAYYNSQTTGQSDNTGKGTARTTAQLQSALPSGFSSSTWGTGTDLYPYLKSFFPNGQQAVSGTAYNSSIAAVAKSTISLYTGGSLLGSTQSGANGYYYIPVASGTIGGPVGLTQVLNGATAVTGATFTETSLKNTYVASDHFVHYGFIPDSYSGVKSQVGATFGSAYTPLLSALSSARHIIQSPDSFVVDTTPEAASGYEFTAFSGNLTVNTDLTFSGNDTVLFDAYDNLYFNANVTATGTNAVKILTSSGAGDYYFAYGKSLSFTNASGGGQSLNINNTAYTLLYNMSDLGSMSSSNGKFALAKSLDASDTSYTSANPVGTFMSGGIFTGLGNTISNLTINRSTSSVGLIATNSGTVRDIGLVGGSISGTSTVGSLAATNSGTIANVWSSASVIGTGSTIGGLTGNMITGTIRNAFTTGSVNGGSIVGGLAGRISAGTITNTWSSGAVTGSSSGVGGLVGLRQGGNLTSSFATGLVSASGAMGGLIGTGGAGTTSSSYYDSSTTGRSDGGKGTPRTTSQLQNGLPSGFSTSFWGAGLDVYPYLRTFFPNGVAVVSGMAYDSSNTTVSGSKIALYSGGNLLGSTYSGANGYYYIPTASGDPANTMTGVTQVLSGESTATGAAFTDNFGLYYGNIPHLDVTSGSFTYETYLDRYSDLLSAAASTFGASNYTSLLSSLSSASHLVTADNHFIIDSALNASGAAGFSALNGDIHVNTDLTIGGSTALTLEAGYNVFLNADVTLTGTNAVALNTIHGDYSFLKGKSLSFTHTAGAGQSLSINGNAYSLLYTQADLLGINGGYGYYALARSLDLSGTTFTDAPITSADGTFTGLGHTLSNLNIDAAGADSIGLIRYNLGTVRDIGIASGTITGYAYTGALVAENHGQILNAYSAADVRAAYRSGGLVGLNDNTIKSSHATGTVTSNGDFGGTSDLGGLVGWNYNNTISQSYATGTVTATGSSAGGLVGFNEDGTIDDSFATGSVFASDFAGGLVGVSFGSSINRSYATGYVSSSDAGGLVGNAGSASITDSYWDMTSSGTSIGIGNAWSSGTPTGLTRSALQSGTLPTGFSGSVWATDSRLYPYLQSQFRTGMQSISGYAYDSTGAILPAATVAVYANGAQIGGRTAASGADGYYYLMATPGTVTGSTRIGITETTHGAGSITGAAYSDAPALTGGQVTGFNVTAGQLTYTTGDTSWSTLMTGAQTAFGSSQHGTLVSALDAATLKVSASGAFSLDQAISRSGNLLIQSGGDLTLTSTGSVTSAASGTAITLAADGSFINNATGSSVSAGNGRWLIYTQAHGNSTAVATANSFGGLNGKSYYNNAFNFTTGAFVATPNSGNRFVTGYAPTLTVTADTGSVTYNGYAQTGTYSLSGYLTGDQSADSFNGSVTGLTTSSKNVGAYTLTASGTLASDLNYGIAYGSAGMLTIDKANLTIAAVTDTKTYDTHVTSTGTVGVTGLLGTDSVTGKSQAFDGQNAGTRTLSVTGYTVNDGNSGNNYTVSTQTAAGSISKAALTIAAGTDTKTYDANMTSTGTVSVTGLLGSDSVTGKSQAFDSQNAGSRTLSVTGYTVNDGNSGGNYDITTQTAAGTISKAALTIAAATDTKTYDTNTTSTGIVSVAGLLGSDSVTGKSQAFDSQNAGTRTLTVTGYTVNDGNSGGNYDVTTQTAAGTISKAALNIAAGTDTKTYDTDTTSTGTVSVTGLLGSDTVTGKTQAFDSKNAGSRTLSVTGYTVNDGNGGGNYAITTQTAAGTIAKANLTIAAGTDSKTYDADTTSAETVSVTGLLGSDTVTGKSQVFDSKNAGNRTLSVTGYTVNDGNNGGNYAVATQNASGEIAKAALTAALTGSTTKTYDATLSATLTAGNYALTGLKGSDTVTLNTPSTGVYADSNTGTGKTVTANGLALGGTDADNYTINASAAANIGSISARKLTLTADTSAKNAGATDPAFTYVFTSGSLAGSDQLSGSLSRTAGEDPGTYDIGQGSLAASSNYDITFIKGAFTITAVALQNNPVVNPVSSSTTAGNQPVVLVAPIGLGAPADSSDASSASSAASDSSGTTATSDDGETNDAGSSAGDGNSEATGPSVQTAGQTGTSCADGDGCANTPYPTNQFISNAISFAGR